MQHKRVMVVMAVVMAALITGACEKPDTAEVRQRQHLPAPGFVANATKGADLFRGNCARCHGIDAQGSNQGPPLIHKIYRPDHHADLTFHWAVSRGAKQHHWHFGDMPPVEGVSPESVGHIVAFIRAGQRAAGIN